MARQTIDQIRAKRGRWSGTVLDPLAGEVAPLFTSTHPDCLTHLTRYAVSVPDRGPIPARVAADAQCGASMPSIRPIDVADASGFVCDRCIAAAERYGLDTFGMIPDTGCSVSGGRRGRNRGRKLGPYSRREVYR